MNEEQIKTVSIDGQSVQVFANLMLASQAATKLCQALEQFASSVPLGAGAALFVHIQEGAKLVNNTLALELQERSNKQSSDDLFEGGE